MWPPPASPSPPTRRTEPIPRVPPQPTLHRPPELCREAQKDNTNSAIFPKSRRRAPPRGSCGPRAAPPKRRARPCPEPRNRTASVRNKAQIHGGLLQRQTDPSRHAGPTHYRSRLSQTPRPVQPPRWHGIPPLLPHQCSPRETSQADRAHRCQARSRIGTIAGRCE